MLGNLIIFALEILLVSWAVKSYLNWIRKRSSAARERATYKQRLPNWIKLWDFITFVILLALLIFALISLSFAAHRLIHPSAQYPTNDADFFLTMPPLILAGVLAMVIANILSWLIPPVRKANEIAMGGLPAASFEQLTNGLLLVLAWLAPICLILISFGVIDPWLK